MPYKTELFDNACFIDKNSEQWEGRVQSEDQRIVALQLLGADSKTVSLNSIINAGCDRNLHPSTVLNDGGLKICQARNPKIDHIKQGIPL